MRFELTPVDKFWQSKKAEHILIVGFTERTGLHIARHLQKNNIAYSVSDQREQSALLKEYHLCPERQFWGEQSTIELKTFSTILISPGVPRKIELLQKAEKMNIPVEVDIDWFSPALEGKVLMGVTGTDGKTTITALLEHLLGETRRVHACGNNGIALFAEYEKLLQSEFVVLELSSYMLESLKRLKLHVALVSNIAEDHLDRYESMQDYIEAKKNILKYTSEDTVFVQNCDDPVLSRWSFPGVETRSISMEKDSTEYRVEGGCFYFNEDVAYAVTDSPIIGKHNQYNVLMAFAALSDFLKPDEMWQRLKSFVPPPHRMAKVRTKRKLLVVNDSKATNLNALSSALSGFSKNITLLLGGRNKGLRFETLALDKERVEHWVCYGEAAKEIAAAIESFAKSICVVNDFDEAVKTAWKKASDGGVLLLSPACTSWDQFKDYEERGERFVEIIHTLDSV